MCQSLKIIQMFDLKTTYVICVPSNINKYYFKTHAGNIIAKNQPKELKG